MIKVNDKDINSIEALELLENAAKESSHEGWTIHVKLVAKCAARLANALNLDSDKAKTLGYLHDIGKKFNDQKNHVINGYKYLKELGLKDEYCNICLTHSFLNNDVNCVAGGIPSENKFLKDFIKNHEYTIYEKIINICDLLCTNNIVSLDKRLINLLVRYNVHTNTIYHIKEVFKLKEYFDNLLGYDLYTLFPEVKENI